ncbi:MAG: hypothetical protein KA793_06015 [Bacteroidales bacterium]|nr:hypothetical protein [Bacteroidales bacterium]
MKILLKTILLLIIPAIMGISGMSCDTENNSVFIRLRNTSGSDYTSVVLNTSFANVGFGDLTSGTTSDYKEFSVAYNYAFVELFIDGSVYTLQPIDYVGETPLKNGHYTYEIDAGDATGRYDKLSLRLVED